MNNENKTETRKRWQINKVKYVNQYQKENYKQFKVTLDKELGNEIDSFLKEKGISKADFVRQAFEELKNKKD